MGTERASTVMRSYLPVKSAKLFPRGPEIGRWACGRIDNIPFLWYSVNGHGNGHDVLDTLW